MLRRSCGIVLLVLVRMLAPAATAGEYNSVLNIGDAAPAWSDLPGTDGKKHSLAELKDKPVVIVVFTCNSCPFAREYEDRIIAAAKAHAEEAAVVAINVNRVPEDRLEKMQERAKERNFPYAYLYDESQQIAKAYGATFTPEVFVLGPKRKISYMGGLDDNSNPAEVKHNYLEPAIAAALKDAAPETAETVARGCRIRYARERK